MIAYAHEWFEGLPPILLLRSDNQPTSKALWESNTPTLARVAQGEERLGEALRDPEFEGYAAYSCSAGREVVFVQATGAGRVNWREGLPCPHTGLNNRCRAAIDLLQRACNLSPASRLYLTEQTTPTYLWLRQRYPLTIGSEYLGPEHAPGAEVRGLRHEDLTQLSLQDSSVNVVASFDVLEHVPDYRGALREIARVLTPGGSALLTFPFTGQQQTTVRASLDRTGKIVHHLPPEYHGDPVGGGQGILCFYHFGHDVLEELHSAGFHEASVLWLWSGANAYLGGLQPYLHARKAG